MACAGSACRRASIRPCTEPARMRKHVTIATSQCTAAARGRRRMVHGLQLATNPPRPPRAWLGRTSPTRNETAGKPRGAKLCCQRSFRCQPWRSRFPPPLRALRCHIVTLQCTAGAGRAGGAGLVPAWCRSGRDRYLTTSVPFMPEAKCAGKEHRKTYSPAAGALKVTWPLLRGPRTGTDAMTRSFIDGGM